MSNMHEKLKHQQVQYLEFLSHNLEKAKKFYIQAFNWNFIDYGPHYTAFEGVMLTKASPVASL